MARLIEQVRAAIRFRQYSLATERSYLQRVRQFILFNEKRHPGEMEEMELLGHKDVKTTMIYTHVVQRGAFGARSPLDITLRSADSRRS